MKAKYYKVFSILSGLLLFVATIGIKPACWTMVYQPKAPKALTEK